VAEPPPGLRLAVKDLFDTAGLRTTYGSAIFAEHVPVQSAQAVERLEAAGYANVGKANLHEFAYGVTSENPHYGAVPNPLAAGRRDRSWARVESSRRSERARRSA
jgi:aspartyl-tRNA(Asn)/glutamyl-tRNA(Gln) amidotransferase subunit A